MATTFEIHQHQHGSHKMCDSYFGEFSIPRRKWSRQLRPYWQTGNKKQKKQKNGQTLLVKRVFPYGPLLIWLRHSRCLSKMYTSSTASLLILLILLLLRFSHCNKEISLVCEKRSFRRRTRHPVMANSPLWKMIVKTFSFFLLGEKKRKKPVGEARWPTKQQVIYNQSVPQSP